MKYMTLIVLSAGALAYLGAAAAAVLFLAREKAPLAGLARRLALAGGCLFLLVFVLRWATWGALPMTTPADALVVFVVLATAVMFASARGKTRAVSSFYVLPISLLAVLCLFAAPRAFSSAPTELRGVFLAGHVILAFLAYALFLGASVTSVAYLFQVRRLKNHHPQGLFHALPSLERLDVSLHSLIQYGYLAFALTLLVGGIWTRVDAELLGPRWYFAPKILQSIIMVVFYAAVFHSRQWGLLRGRKLAFAVLAGFSLMLGIYLVRALFGLSYYYFWEASVWAS